MPAAGINIDLSLARFGTPPGIPGIQKDSHDLLRYERIIADTRPDVLIECGSDTGHSANWFGERVPHVITIDNDPSRWTAPVRDNVTRIIGSSLDPDVGSRVAELVEGKRVMVSLDSDHTALHVKAEIRQWIHLVSDGCYLVIEDGIYHYRPDPDHLDWDPLDAISVVMPRTVEFVRDRKIEGLYEITGSPAGWWQRRIARPVVRVPPI